MVPIQDRIYSHFYITNLDAKVRTAIDNCANHSQRRRPKSQSFTKKTTQEPIKPNAVPDKCWEEVSVDLFGPLPSHEHIIVRQDLKSRYPVAKIVNSTSAKVVIPMMEDTYDLFGKTDWQKSDNGSPFNSHEMLKFTTKRNIQEIKSPPGHPTANNVETFMKPLGKAIKIGLGNNEKPQDTLKSFLGSYRDTLHVSTGISPGAMIFRDGCKANFTHQEASADVVHHATEKDIHTK